MSKIKSCFFMCLVALGILFVSCDELTVTSTSYEAQTEQGITPEMGIVHRVFKADSRYHSQYSIRLTNGLIFRRILSTDSSTPDDFFFLQEGDTVFYKNKKIVGIRFKN